MITKNKNSLFTEELVVYNAGFNFLVETAHESSHKELIDVRRQFADATCAKEKYSGSNKELREHIKRVEGQKREQSRSLEEALQKISGVFSSH